MTTSLLWFSVALMAAAILLRKDNKIAEIISGAGWLIFGFYWVTLIPHYYAKADYVNIALAVSLFLFCLVLANFTARAFKNETRRKYPKHADSVLLDNRIDVFFSLTKMIAVVCIVYMPFYLFPPLNHLIIETVAAQTVDLLNFFGYGAVSADFDTIAYKGIYVSVVLACTAIESIAFFTGVILAIPGSSKSKGTAFLLTVPVIYLLNLARNAFIVAAYGGMWFGADSFEIAHHYIGKAGSGFALIIFSYATMKLLPDLIDVVLRLWELVVDEIRFILKMKPKSKDM
ncbi:MAG: archaeosortase A [Methanosarcinales archaeon]|jgi:archaeosortase A (PGF-CTERM-specific)|nr:archaeosortase A [Methanosarcinales archaeon]